MPDTTTPVEPAETLSGRPVVDVDPEPSRTRLSAGAVVGAAVLGLAVLGAAVLVLLDRGPEGTDVRDMDPGECYIETDVVTEGGRPVPHGRDAPCLPGSPRVLAVVTLPLGPYPGPDGLNRVVADHCNSEQDLIVAPTQETWTDGDRTVACIAL